MNITCLCGEVELAIDGDAYAHFYCHCDDCQRVFGGAYMPEAAFPADSVKVVRGETISYTLVRTPRVSCAKCGTRLFAEVKEAGVRGVSGHLLPAFKPEFHIMCDFAVLPVRDNLAHYRRAPARFGGNDDVVDW